MPHRGYHFIFSIGYERSAPWKFTNLRGRGDPLFGVNFGFLRVMVVLGVLHV